MKKNLLTLDVALSKEIKYMLKEEHYLPGDKLPSWSLESVTSR